MFHFRGRTSARITSPFLTQRAENDIIIIQKQLSFNLRPYFLSLLAKILPFTTKTSIGSQEIQIKIPTQSFAIRKSIFPDNQQKFDAVDKRDWSGVIKQSKSALRKKNGNGRSSQINCARVSLFRTFFRNS